MSIETLLQWGVPFASGAAGVYAGLKVGLARLEANYTHLKMRIEENNKKLEEQVGETRCREYRMDCRENIHCRLDDIFEKLDKMDKTVLETAIKVARIEKSTE